MYFNIAATLIADTIHGEGMLVWEQHAVEKNSAPETSISYSVVALITSSLFQRVVTASPLSTVT
jgi:hypothetical protein